MSQLDYDKLVFIVVEPPSRIISTHRIKDHEEHLKIITAARSKGNCLYHATAVEKDGKYRVVQPWVIDLETLPLKIQVKAPAHVLNAIETPKVEVNDPDDLQCPYCSKLANSTSGLTLHIKSKHAEHQTKVEIETQPQELITKTGLACPFCGLEAKTTSGRTNHVKSKHPDRLAEYLKADD